jgi:hypothetical protein
MARNTLLTLALGVAALWGSYAEGTAQGFPVPPGTVPGAQNPACTRLEGQLAAIDRGPLDPSRAAQIHRYEEAINRQQAELNRVVTRLRQTGCEGSGFFSLFRGQPAECGPLNRQVQQMHDNIDRMMTELQRLQGNTAGRENERRSVLLALAQNNCGPQYRQAALARRDRGLFESLFSPDSATAPDEPGLSEPVPGAPQSSSFRTVCVRTCDGFYWPISFSTGPARFAEDDRACHRMCPAAPVALFTHRNPGEDMNQAVSLSGQRYADLPTAFLYRKQYTPSCMCKQVGETWAHALQNVTDTIERGDIVVTEERAKQLSKPQETRPSKPAARGNARTGAEEGAAPSPKSGSPAAAETSEHEVRRVGPTFLPAH